MPTRAHLFPGPEEGSTLNINQVNHSFGKKKWTHGVNGEIGLDSMNQNFPTSLIKETAPLARKVGIKTINKRLEIRDAEL